MTLDQALERIAELEAENAYYKSEMGLLRDAARVVALQTSLGIRRTQAKFLLALWGRRGRVATRDWLTQAMYAGATDEDEPLPSNIDVLVCHTRAKIGRDAIATLWGQGYALGEGWGEKIAAVVAEAA